MAHPYWPFFDLRITTPRLELRPGTDAELVELAAITDDIHAEGEMPFATQWSIAPSPERERNTLQWHWKTRAELKADDWHIGFVVFRDGKIIGTQGLMATDFSTLRSVSTGSWLTRSSQGYGFGKEMRAAVLHFAFATLGAKEAHTEAMAWNQKSQGVTRSLGYQPNGVHQVKQGDKAETEVRYRMDRQQWEAGARNCVEVQVSGHEACLPLLGASAPTVERHGSDQTLS